MPTSNGSNQSQPSGGVAVVETSVLWASGNYLGSDDGALDVPDEFADSRELFINLLHNLLLFDELRTGLNIGEEEDWYTTGVFEMIDRLKDTVQVTDMPPLQDGDALDYFADAFSERLDFVIGQGDKASKYPLPTFYEKRVIRRRSSDELIFNHLLQRMETMKAAQSWGPQFMTTLGANGTFIFRGLRYAAHANSLATEGHSAVYSASPGRIVALARFLDPSEVVDIPFLQSKDYVRMIDSLGLPRSGYDWRFLNKTMRPLQSPGLTEQLLKMRPREALDRVLEIRTSPEGQRIRQIWAERLWRTSLSCIEGPVSLSVSHSHANTIVQIFAAARNATAELLARQEVKDSIVRGGIAQHADAAVLQKVEATEADELSQRIQSKLPGFIEPLSRKKGLLERAKSAAQAAFGVKQPQMNVSGTVKRFHGQKGNAFVSPDDGSSEVFVGRRIIERSGLKGLKMGDRVQMAVREGDRGLWAAAISLIADRTNT